MASTAIAPPMILARRLRRGWVVETFGGVTVESMLILVCGQLPVGTVFVTARL
jgi:hypothetical protein